MKKDRIIYLDLLRAFAVLMMVQGHTVDSLLAFEYRDESSILYLFWHTMRGFTAPIFMFTAGVVFTYLLLLGKEAKINSFRLKKGFKRFLLLVAFGYLLRYPTYTILDFTDISPLQWNVFFTVDTLHLIGFGILFILLFAVLSEKLNINKQYAFSIAAFLLFAVSPFINNNDFIYLLHPFLAGYFTENFGSLFPLFPWAGYVLWGAALGTFLAKKERIFAKQSFSYVLIGVGTFFILVHLSYLLIFSNILSYANYLSAYSILIFRLGFVLLLSGVLALISKKMESIPEIIKTIGRHTLSIYVAHSIILYGSAWSVGLTWIFGKTFTPIQVIFTAIVMIALMISMAYYFEKMNGKNFFAAKLKPLIQTFMVK